MTPRRARAVERRVTVISKRGRFLVGDPLFERDGDRITLGGGRKVRPGALALLEVSNGRGKVLEDLGRPDRAAVITAQPKEPEHR